MKYLLWFCVFLLCFSLYLSIINKSNDDKFYDVVYVDSIVHDTLFVEKPSYIYKYIVRYDTVELETICHDTVWVNIPIESKMYADSNYSAWISGYKTSLDSIKVYPSTVYQTKIKETVQKRRFGLGLQVGYGYPYGAYVGIGVNYNILNW